MILKIRRTSKKDDIRFFTSIIFAFLFLVWLCTPPGNKFMQLCLWGNHTKYFIAKYIQHSDINEYIFHRNNAIYLARMYKDKKKALQEIDNAIKTVPAFASDKELKTLYKERAQIRLMAKDYNGALNDYINSGQININDCLTVAMLFKLVGNYREAMSYCNEILEKDNLAFAGYACLSDLYDSYGRPDYALKVWDLAIDRKTSNARFYAERAKIKKKMGDIEGYNADVKIAKEYSPTIDIDESIIDQVLSPKILSLAIK